MLPSLALATADECHSSVVGYPVDGWQQAALPTGGEGGKWIRVPGIPFGPANECQGISSPVVSVSLSLSSLLSGA